MTVPPSVIAFLIEIFLYLCWDSNVVWLLYILYSTGIRFCFTVMSVLVFIVPDCYTFPPLLLFLCSVSSDIAVITVTFFLCILRNIR